jgi:GH18 family chitinase
MSDETASLCDIIYFDVFNFNTTSDIVSTSEEALCCNYMDPEWNNVIANFKIPALMENADRLRKAGVKVIGSFMLWDTAGNMMRISASADLREKLAASIMAVMEQLQLDGLFLQWMWPGCPKVKSKVGKVMTKNMILTRDSNADLLTRTESIQSNLFLPSGSL